MERIVKKAKSVRVKLFLILCLVVLSIIAFLILVNSFVLEKYYQYTKSNQLKSAYNMINTYYNGGSKITDLDEELDLKEEIIDEKKNKRVKKFLENISKKNRRVAEMIMDGRNVANITEVCGISYSQYRDAISEFRLYENISILLKDEEE